MSCDTLFNVLSAIGTETRPNQQHELVDASVPSYIRVTKPHTVLNGSQSVNTPAEHSGSLHIHGRNK